MRDVTATDRIAEQVRRRVAGAVLPFKWVLGLHDSLSVQPYRSRAWACNVPLGVLLPSTRL